VDVDQQVVPADDVTAGIAKRIPTRLKPAVLTIEASSAYLELERLSFRDRTVEDRDDARKILGMCGVARLPFPQLVQRAAEVLVNLAVDELDLSGRREGRDQPWNAVHDQPRLAFALAQRVLGSLSIVDVGQQHAPANDLTARIAKRKAVIQKPAIGAVGPSEALRDLVRSARGDRLRKHGDDLRQV